MVAWKVERPRAASLDDRAAQKLGNLDQAMHRFLCAARIFGDDHRILRAGQQIRELFDAFLIGGCAGRDFPSHSLFDATTSNDLPAFSTVVVACELVGRVEFYLCRGQRYLGGVPWRPRLFQHGLRRLPVGELRAI